MGVSLAGYGVNRDIDQMNGEIETETESDSDFFQTCFLVNSVGTFWATTTQNHGESRYVIESSYRFGEGAQAWVCATLVQKHVTLTEINQDLPRSGCAKGSWFNSRSISLIE